MACSDSGSSASEHVSSDCSYPGSSPVSTLELLKSLGKNYLPSLLRFGTLSVAWARIELVAVRVQSPLGAAGKPMFEQLL